MTRIELTANVRRLECSSGRRPHLWLEGYSGIVQVKALERLEDPGFARRGASRRRCTNLLFCQKLHENERIRTERGRVHSALGSATD